MSACVIKGKKGKKQNQIPRLGLEVNTNGLRMEGKVSNTAITPLQWIALPNIVSDHVRPIFSYMK